MSLPPIEPATVASIAAEDLQSKALEKAIAAYNVAEEEEGETFGPDARRLNNGSTAVADIGYLGSEICTYTYLNAGETQLDKAARIKTLLSKTLDMMREVHDSGRKSDMSLALDDMDDIISMVKDELFKLVAAAPIPAPAAAPIPAPAAASAVIDLTGESVGSKRSREE